MWRLKNVCILSLGKFRNSFVGDVHCVEISIFRQNIQSKCSKRKLGRRQSSRRPFTMSLHSFASVRNFFYKKNSFNQCFFVTLFNSMAKSACSLLHFYVLSDPNLLQKDTFKLGVHKGSQEKLRKRYITAIPNVIILLFIPCTEARVIEKMVLCALGDRRQQNDLKNQSEWIQIPIETLNACVSKALRFFDDFKSFHKHEFKQSKKRKLSEARTSKTPEFVDNVCQDTSINENSREFFGKTTENTLPQEPDSKVPNGKEEVIYPKAMEMKDSKVTQAFAELDDPRVKMEFSESKVRQAFIAYVMSLESPGIKTLNSEFLRKLLFCLKPTRDIIERAPNSKFPLSLSLCSKTLGCEPYEFARLVLGTQKKQENRGKKRFLENVDYIYAPSNELYVTPKCFAKAAMLCRKDRGDMVREYFSLVDIAFRDWAGESILQRLSFEEPSVTKH